jgi:hypothetical protein
LDKLMDKYSHTSSLRGDLMLGWGSAAAEIRCSILVKNEAL